MMKNLKKVFEGIIFGAFIFFLYYLICPLLFSYLFKPGLKSDNFWITNLTQLAIYLFTFLIILLIIRKEFFKQLKEFFKNPKKILTKGFSYWAYGIITMIIANLIVTSIVGGIAVNEQTTRETLSLYPIYAIPTIIFLGPVLEELVFRFCFRKTFTKELTFAFFSAFIFGLLHVTTAIDEFTISNIIAHASEFLFIVPYGSLGFFFAKAYYETENIFSSIVPHILHNILSVILILITSFVR